MNNEIWTIGHSNRTLDAFISLLIQNNIQAIADVRSVPFSKYANQFNQYELSNELDKHGIKYSFLGDQLGGRSKSQMDFEDNQIQYSRLRKKETYLAGLERIKKVVPSMKVALLCTEKDPIKCHRFVLVSMDLISHGLNVNHIYELNDIRSHHEVLEKLVEENTPSQHSLFNDIPTIEEILLKQEKKIAYTITTSDNLKEEI